jgi:hypothetical protein
MELSKRNAQHYYSAAKDALVAEKPALMLEFFRAAIAERERGDMSLWQVGTKTLSLIGSLKTPPVKLSNGGLMPSDVILDKLYGVAGGLDLAEQGGTTPEADEKLWQSYKQIVDEYEVSMKG